MTISNAHKEKIVAALLDKRERFDGTDGMFAKQFSVNNSVFSQLKNGKIEGLLRDNQWLQIGRELNVSLNDREWKIVRTEVLDFIEEEVRFCQSFSKSMMFVDECEIGKSESAKYLARTLKNCFYVDCSQAKTKQLFCRLLAKTIGVESTGRLSDVVANTKYYLSALPNPIVIIDEAGDLDYPAFLELKSYWNATENQCGWYMLGADGLRAKINRGKSSQKVGYAEMFSRFSSRYSKIVPTGREDRMQFYSTLVGDVLKANIKNQKDFNKIHKQCLVMDSDGSIGGLRRCDYLIKIHA